MRDPVGERVVFSSRFAVEAQLAQLVLREAGIRSRIVDESASAYEPSLRMVCPLYVVVLESDGERALEVVTTELA